MNYLSNKKGKGGYYLSRPRYVGSTYTGSRVVQPYDFSGGQTRVSKEEGS